MGKFVYVVEGSYDDKGSFQGVLEYQDVQPFFEIDGNANLYIIEDVNNLSMLFWT